MNDWSNQYIVAAGRRPLCEETIDIVMNDTLTRFNANELEECTVNEVPGTFTYYSVCATASCLPVDYCESVDL